MQHKPHKSNLDRHVDLHHSTNQGKFVCDKCGNEYGTLTSLKTHEMNQHPSYSMCTYCEKLFKSKNMLRLHLMKVHTVRAEANKPSYFCWLCSQNQLSVRDLDEHLVKKHKVMSGVSKCQICEQAFCCKKTLKIHVVEKHDLESLKSTQNTFASQLFGIVKEEPKYVGEFGCQLCEKRFSHRRTLAVHIKQYHDKSNHIKCRYCDYTSFQPNLVKKHEEIKHLKVTFHKCNLCKFESYNLCSLKKHIRTVHEKERKFECQECGNKYQAKKRLLEHLMQDHNILSQTDS